MLFTTEIKLRLSWYIYSSRLFLTLLRFSETFAVHLLFTIIYRRIQSIYNILENRGTAGILLLLLLLLSECQMPTINLLFHNFAQIYSASVNDF